MKRWIKLLLSIALPVGAITLFLLITPALAQEESAEVKNQIYERQNLNLDENLSEKSQQNYRLAKKLMIVEYEPNDGTYSKEGFLSWYKELYYHYIVKQRFLDLPFNYIISPSGDIYQGLSGYKEAQTWFEKEPEDGVLLVLVPKNGHLDSNILPAVQKLALQYTVEQLTVVELVSQTVTNQESKPNSFRIRQEHTSTAWNQAVSTGRADYSQRTLKVDLVDVSYSKAIDQGKDLLVTVKLKNNSDWNLYNSPSHRFYIATYSPKNHKSKFVLHKQWDSASKVGTFEEEYINPGQEFTIDFRMATPLIPGNYKERFATMVLPNDWFDNTKFTVNFKVIDGGLKLAKVINNKYGFLNVRENPWAKARKLFELDLGDVVVYLDYKNGWARIRTKDGRTGWVVSRYIRQI